MNNSHLSRGNRPTSEADITYVTDNQRDAEALAYQTGRPVRIERPASDRCFWGPAQIRLTEQIVCHDARNVLDV